MEHLFIFKLSKSTKLVNRRNKLYGVCKQNLKLHRFNTDDPPGDKVEMEKPKRVNPPKFTFNPVGQTLAAVRRYSAGQRFTSPQDLGINSRIVKLSKFEIFNCYRLKIKKYPFIYVVI